MRRFHGHLHRPLSPRLKRECCAENRCPQFVISDVTLFTSVTRGTGVCRKPPINFFTSIPEFCPDSNSPSPRTRRFPPFTFNICDDACLRVRPHSRGRHAPLAFVRLSLLAHDLRHLHRARRGDTRPGSSASCGCRVPRTPGNNLFRQRRRRSRSLNAQSVKSATRSCNRRNRTPCRFPFSSACCCRKAGSGPTW
jgi:hypothetical protein